LLCLKDRVDALRWNDNLTFEVENEGSVMSIENYHVNLIAKLSIAVYYVGLLSGVSLRKIGFEKIKPNAFAGITFSWRVAK
jgi:hypothetical protein